MRDFYCYVISQLTEVCVCVLELAERVPIMPWGSPCSRLKLLSAAHLSETILSPVGNNGAPNTWSRLIRAQKTGGVAQTQLGGQCDLCGLYLRVQSRLCV